MKINRRAFAHSLAAAAGALTLPSVPLAPDEEWGTRADFSPLVERRDIDFAGALHQP